MTTKHDFPFNELLGKTFIGIERNDSVIVFVTETETFRMHHAQECCEDVEIESIVGDLVDLVGNPILFAEVSQNEKTLSVECMVDHETWTFYKLATIKGYVDIRWCGSSNGYYSEEVNFDQVQ